MSRVGDDLRVGQLAQLGATVIDLTEVEANESAHHDKFYQLATIAPELRGVLAKGIASNPHATDLTETAAAGGLGSVVALPITLLGAPIRMIANQ